MKKEQNIKTEYLIIGGLFIFLLAVALTFLVFQTKSMNKVKVTKPTESSTALKPANPSSEPTVDWKTYSYPSKTGETYEIKYPPTWDTMEANGIEEVDGVSTGSAWVYLQNRPFSGPIPKSESYISVSRRSKSKEEPKTTVNFTEQEKNYNSARDIKISGIDALQTSNLRDGGRAVSFRYRNYDFMIQEILMGDEKDNIETQEVFLSILSTFKFTN